MLALLFSIRKKGEKSEAKNLCVCVDVRGGSGALQHKKDDNRFDVQDLRFSEFRVDPSKQNAAPSTYFMNLVFDFFFFFFFFQDSRKIQCELHDDHMKFLMCYLFSGLTKTAKNSQNAIKESPPKASQTQKIVFHWGLRPPESLNRVLPWTHKVFRI